MIHDTVQGTPAESPAITNDYSLIKWLSAIVYFSIKDNTIGYTRNTNRYYIFELVSHDFHAYDLIDIKDAFCTFFVEIYYNSYW